MQKLKINLFGELWTLKKVVLNPIEQEYFEQIASRLKLPLHEALLDPFFYFHLKLTNIVTLNNLPCEEKKGLMNTPKNLIEIWLDGKKIQKITHTDLNQEQYLFPIFSIINTTQNAIESPGIYIEQKEMGYIGSYEFKVNDFNFEKLQFELIHLKHQQLLQNITFANKKGVFKKKDTLITYQNSFTI
jgi:hypothetical protein